MQVYSCSVLAYSSTAVASHMCALYLFDIPIKGCKIRKLRTGRHETKTQGNFLFKNAQSQKLSILLADCRAVVFCKRNHSISKELCKNKQ